MRTLWLVLGIVLIWASYSEAACTNNGGGVWTAASPSETEIGLCMTAASAGNRINVPAGTASWGTNGMNITKAGLQIIGAGAGATVISGAGPHIDRANGVRVSGFTFNGTASSSVAGIGVVVMQGAEDFRFDHNTVNNVNWSSPLGCIFTIGSLDGSTSNERSYGLIDHNTLTNCRILVWGEWIDTEGHRAWFDHGNALGTQYAVFVEDNTYTINPGTPGPGMTCDNTGRVLCNFVDTGHGGAIVVRFNTVHNSYFEQHSTHGARGSKLFEVYHNTLDLGPTFQPNFSRPFYFQGAGTGMIFENHSSNNYQFGELSYDYERDTDGDSRWGACNGSNNVDGNDDATGWVCLDQPGTSHDVALYSGSGAHPGQGYAPFYTWNNDQPNGTWTWVPNENNTALNNHVKLNRDLYQRVTPFTGTTGVGVGTLAARPATCTTGVGYWATDQGEWNNNQVGSDGQLYRCTAPNTWTLYYKPYTYPHPLQAGGGGGDTTPPAAPINLRVL